MIIRPSSYPSFSKPLLFRPNGSLCKHVFPPCRLSSSFSLYAFFRPSFLPSFIPPSLSPFFLSEFPPVIPCYCLRWPSQYFIACDYCTSTVHGAQMLLDQSVRWLRKVTGFVPGYFVKFVFNDQTKLNTYPDPNRPSRRFWKILCALFCDFTRNYYCTVNGATVLHSFITSICIEPLQVGLLRGAPNPNTTK